jgi:hypothetical protein
MAEDLTKILTEKMDDETLSKMPAWLKTLRDNYRKNRINYD